MTAAEIAKRIGGQVIGDGSVQLKGFAPADAAKSGDLTFAENADYFTRAEKSAAAAVLVDADYTSSKVLIRVPKARVAFAKVLTLFSPPKQFEPGIHPSAVVTKSAQIDPSAHIGPHCVIGERIRIGPRTVLEAGNFIGDDSV